MGKVIKGNFGERPNKDEPEKEKDKTGTSKKAGDTSITDLNVDQLHRISESMRRGDTEDRALEGTGINDIGQLKRTLEGIILNERGLEKTKLDLIRGLKPHIAENLVKRELAKYNYTKEHAASIIRNSDEGKIKSKPAFFLSLLMTLELYN